MLVITVLIVLVVVVSLPATVFVLKIVVLSLILLVFAAAVMVEPMVLVVLIVTSFPSEVTVANEVAVAFCVVVL